MSGFSHGIHQGGVSISDIVEGNSSVHAWCTHTVKRAIIHTVKRATHTVKRASIHQARTKEQSMVGYGVSNLYVCVQYLANASETRRPTSCLMILPKPIKATDAGPDEAFTKLYKTVHKKMAKLEHIPH